MTATSKIRTYVSFGYTCMLQLFDDQNINANKNKTFTMVERIRFAAFLKSEIHLREVPR